MVANTALLLTNPDFANIRSSLKNFLKAQEQFKDYDFDGSNLSVVLDVLAYNTYQDAFLNNMNIAESFLDTAQLRSSIVSRAKELGYTPRSKRSALASLTVKITPTDSPGNITIPKQTSFTTSIGNKSYTFSTARAHNIAVNSNSEYIITNVDVYEGFNLTEAYTISDVNQKFQISNKDVDTDSIEIIVNELGANNTYTFTDSIVGITNSSNVYFIQQNYNGYYEVEFGDGNIGYYPPNDTTVYINYRVSSGTDPNGALLFSPIGSISGYTNVVVTTTSIASGGADAESDESIRKYAPLLNQTRGRAFTTNDYEVMLKQQFPEIQAISAYGGEELDPPRYGSVYLSIDIAGVDGIPDLKKDQYYKFIRNKCPTLITPVFIDPNYIYLGVTSNVYYDYIKTDLSANDIESSVRTTIDNYNQNTLSNFNSTLRYTRFCNAIDESDTSIQSNDTNIKIIIQRTAAQLNVTQSLNVYNAITAVSSTNFNYNNLVCNIVDDSNGNLVIQNTNASGVVSNVKTIGTVNYDTGTLYLNAFEVQSIIGTNLRLFLTPKNKDITASLNNILNFDNNYINIKAIAQ